MGFVLMTLLYIIVLQIQMDCRHFLTPQINYTYIQDGKIPNKRSLRHQVAGKNTNSTLNNKWVVNLSDSPVLEKSDSCNSQCVHQHPRTLLNHL